MTRLNDWIKFVCILETLWTRYQMAMPNVFTYDAQLVEGRLQYSCQIHPKGHHRMKVHSLYDQNQPL